MVCVVFPLSSAEYRKQLLHWEALLSACGFPRGGSLPLASLTSGRLHCNLDVSFHSTCVVTCKDVRMLALLPAT